MVSYLPAKSSNMLFFCCSGHRKQLRARTFMSRRGGHLETRSIEKPDIADADDAHGEADRVVTDHPVGNCSPPRAPSIVAEGARIQTDPEEAEATIHQLETGGGIVPNMINPTTEDGEEGTNEAARLTPVDNFNIVIKSEPVDFKGTVAPGFLAGSGSKGT
jgi:hypothetical protein